MTASQKGRIFISYRRMDSAGYAGRIYDRLSAHFGTDAVFMDVDTIDAGVDFVNALQTAVVSCDVLLVLIGRQWLSVKDEMGNRRLDNPEDFVRVEVAAALNRDIRVIPVLVDGVSMPRSTELPENLKPLARRNALQVNHHSFDADANRLISQLELAIQAAEQTRVEKARGEKEAREQKTNEEQVRKEKKANQHAVVDKHAMLAAELQAKKEKEDQERRKAEEKSQKERRRSEKKVVRLNHRSELRTRIVTWLNSYWRTLSITGIVIVAFIGLIVGGKYLVSAIPVSSEPTPVQSLQLVLTNSPSPQPTQTALSEYEVGSTIVSEKDGMVMVYVPAGEFLMGSEDGVEIEKPIHSVILDSFWIDQNEVTNEMYRECVFAGACEPPVEVSSFTRESYYGAIEYFHYPVINITWYQAKDYCEWNARRLPSEAEWEKAAGWDEKLQVQRVYPWGNTIKPNQNYANYDKSVGDTTLVRSYELGVSYYGAYDMAGNVWEWVADLRLDNPDFAYMRGGSWDLGDYYIRAAYRFPWQRFRYSFNIGFRCASDADVP